MAKLNVALVRCGRCKKKYNNPLTHVCATQMGSRPGRTRVGPKLTVKCGKCGRGIGNPLTHRCVQRTDFRKRKAAASKPTPKPATSGNAHEYTACQDDNCPRFPCKVYKEGVMDGYAVGFPNGFGEGLAAGYEKGFEDGRRRGYEEGYAAGFPDGLASCPGPHGG